jgi:hypothetical protein
MAAGQGFKNFSSGEVLTAADVNGYLMQGVGVFTDAANRDAEITSPQEGQFAYLKDTNVTTYYTGSAWANLDTTGMTNPMTTTGDTIYSSSGSTPARLGIGSTGDVLTVAGGVPSWAAPAGGGADYTLINTGGTTLSGASTVTVSGISGKNSLFIFTEGDFDADANAVFTLRFNSDTGSNYTTGVFKLTTGSPFVTSFQVFANNQSVPIGNQGTGATCYGAFYMKIDGCNSTGIKPFQLTSVVEASSAANASISYNGTGRYKGTSAISSVSLISSAGNFSAGTIYVFGA